MEKKSLAVEKSAKVSVLVPICNVERYLRQCLDSIVAQTLEDIEIICINDGSTDGSLGIIESYAKQDQRIIVIDKKNSGYGDSMNKGLDKATGTYIGIVESDDFVDPEMFETLYDLLEKSEAQAAKCNFYHYSSGGGDVIFEVVDPDEVGMVINPRDHHHIFFQVASIWAGLYRRDFLEKHGIRFLPTPGASYQDTSFGFKIWALANKVVYSEHAFLHYRIDNASSSINSREKAFYVTNELHEMEKFLTDAGLSGILGSILAQRRFDIYCWNLDRISGQNANEFADLMAKEFLQDEQNGFLDRSMLSSRENQIRDQIVSNPKRFLAIRRCRRFARAVGSSIKHAAKRVIGRIPLSRYKQHYLIAISGELTRANRDLSSRIDGLEKRLCPAKQSPEIESAGEPRISIIVPIYNREKFLVRCIESLLNQTMTAIEIICIDDGSTDDSLSIIRRFEQQDPRVVVVSQTNQGVAAARNAGLDHVSAPFIMWCDSDDYYDATMCEQMYKTIVAENVDIVICSMNIIFNVPTHLRKDVDEYVRLKYVGRKTIDRGTIIHTDVSMPNKIFRKSIIDTYDIRFPNGLLFEDAYFCDEYMTVSKDIYYLNRKLYNYIRHEDSIMSNSFKKSGTAADYFEIIKHTYDYFKRYQLFDKYCDLFWHRFIQYYAFAFDNSPRQQKSILRHEGKRFVREHTADLEGVEEVIKADLFKLLRAGRTFKMFVRNRIVRDAYRSIRKSVPRYGKIIDNVNTALQQSYSMARDIESLEALIDTGKGSMTGSRDI